MRVEPESAGVLVTDDIRQHYDQLSPLYRTFWGEHIHHGFWRGDETAAEAQVNLSRELAQRAAIAPDSAVLDVGCGLGGSALLLAKEYGCWVKGISISPKQIAAANREAKRRSLLDRVEFAVEDANELPATGESYDVVWTIECSEHLFDKARFIATCAQRLKPGGRLAICAWLAGENLQVEQRQTVDDVCRGMLCPSLATMSEYVGWMENSGLVVQSADDITRHVARTWVLCRPVLDFPFVKTILATGSRRLNEFANSFASIAAAYRTGAMAYGMLVGQKPGQQLEKLG
jgi:tocopherol O-methyltransferase